MRLPGALRHRDRRALLLTSDVFLVLSAFLASAVETVEALTIVLAMGITRGWRSALTGLGAATVALAAIVGALGPALTLIPIDVLRLVARGLTNPQIAQTLLISPKTAEAHVSNILGKLGVATRTEAAAVTYRLHLLDNR